MKILDFGSARSEMDQFNRELSVIVKVGYAPIEQYGGHGKQGPYTDIYALGATFYHLFTSKMPIESTQRVAEDNLEEFSRLRPDLPDNLKYCIEKSMELTTAKRISSIAEMKSILELDNKPSKNNKIAPPILPEQNNKKDTVIKKQEKYKTASIGMRLGAYMVDLLLWSVIYFTILFGVFEISDTSFELGVLFPVIFTLINTISELLASTTVGKAMMKMYIRGKSSVDVLPSQILLRNIIKLLGIFVVVFARNDELLEDRVTNSIVYIKE